MPTDPSNQTPRKDPNFLLVVVLAAIVLVLILVSSFFTIDWEGKRLVPRARMTAHPTSQLHVTSSSTLTA